MPLLSIWDFDQADVNEKMSIKGAQCLGGDIYIFLMVYK